MSSLWLLVYFCIIRVILIFQRYSAIFIIAILGSLGLSGFGIIGVPGVICHIIGVIRTRIISKIRTSLRVFRLIRVLKLITTDQL